MGKRGLLNCVLELTAAVQRVTQAPAAFQITQHCFGYHVHRFGVFSPFELLLARLQMVERVFHPQEIGLTLAHTCRSFPGVAIAGIGSDKCNHGANGEDRGGELVLSEAASGA
jgi:hypothetical protein